MSDPIGALNNILKNKRSLPNGGGNYSTANSTPMGISYPPTNQFDFTNQAPVTQQVAPPVEAPVDQQAAQPVADYSSQPGANDYQPAPVQAPAAAPAPAPSTSGVDYMDKYRQLALEQARHSSQGTGLYALQPGVQYTPDQIMSQRKSADDIYDQTLGEYSKVAQKQLLLQKKIPSYGLDSIFANLSPQLVTKLTSEENDFKSEPIVKKFNIIQDAAIQARQLQDRIGSKQSSGSDDQRLIYLFAKAQDPDSVVREGEYATTAKYISTLPEQAKAAISRVLNLDPTKRGLLSSAPVGFLTPEARKQVVDALQEQYRGNKNSYDNLRTEYSGRIDRYSGHKGLGDNMLTNYQGAYDNYKPEGGNSNAQDDEALKGYSQEEIDAFKKEHGISFNTVGNTTASVEIPKESRLSFVNNNPGNLRFAEQSGASKGEGGFAKFNSPTDGLNALQNQISLDSSRGHTLASFINKFAPPSENDTSTYVSQAAKSLGVSQDTPMSKIPVKDLTRFIAMKESSTKV